MKNSFSVFLLDGFRLKITFEQRRQILQAVAAKQDIICLDERCFARHQIKVILPDDEADFYEKMHLREKGFFRCNKGVIHKIGSGKCDCRDTGEIDPRIKSGNALLEN